jgi:hypothetical protein
MVKDFKATVMKIDRKEDMSVCPSCGYEDGFHVSFHTPDRSKTSEVILICPNCHKRFRIGWQASLFGN